MRKWPTKLRSAILRDGGYSEKIVPWIPSRQQEKESTLPQKVINIPPYSDTTNDVALLNWIKRTWAGQIYKAVSEKNHFIRHAVNRIWRSLYPLFFRTYSLYLNGYESCKWRPIVRHEIYAQREMIVNYKLVDASIVKTPAPKVYPLKDQAYLKEPHGHYEFPEICVSIKHDATICGGTNLILVNDEVICHDLYDFETDYTSEELHARTFINGKSGLIKWLVHDKSPAKISAAAVFVDALAPNYAHWLTEVLPRVAIFGSDERFKQIPLVLNADLHPNIMSSLFAVIDHGREIFSLPVGRALNVGKLYFTSPTGYVPFGRRSNNLGHDSHGVFSPEAFSLLREILINHGPDEGVWPKHIFIRRSSGTRRIMNAHQIETVLSKMGYVIVEPEKLTFSQQVRLFSQAESIVGGSGAAMANLIFAHTNCRTVILIAKVPYTAYWYWQNIALSCGNKVTYVIGESTAHDRPGIHDNFRVSLQDVIDAVTQKAHHG